MIIPESYKDPTISLHLAMKRKYGARDIISVHQEEPTFFLSWDGFPFE
jgi:hypothetical protein